MYLRSAAPIAEGFPQRDLLRRRLHQDRAVVLDRPERIPGNFPQVAVRAGEVAVVAAPEGVARLDENLRPRGARLLHRGVHLLLRAAVVRESEAAGAADP